LSGPEQLFQHFNLFIFSLEFIHLPTQGSFRNGSIDKGRAEYAARSLQLLLCGAVFEARRPCRSRQYLFLRGFPRAEVLRQGFVGLGLVSKRRRIR